MPVVAGFLVCYETIVELNVHILDTKNQSHLNVLITEIEFCCFGKLLLSCFLEMSLFFFFAIFYTLGSLKLLGDVFGATVVVTQLSLNYK